MPLGGFTAHVFLRPLPGLWTMQAPTLACLLFLLLVGVKSLVPADEITTLPGWKGPLPSRHFSGYIEFHSNCDDSYHTHYWFIESQNKPATDPLIIWLNGGPGTSALLGLFTENIGPFFVNDDSLKTQPPTLQPNPYSWSTVANLLFLELPNGVGFSYCVGGCPFWQDETAAQNNYLALCYFFKSYPEFARHTIYLVGESYAGVYIPTLMQQIQNGSCPFVKINLKGAAIGNGCSGTDVGPCDQKRAGQTAQFLGTHGMASDSLASRIQSCLPSQPWTNPSPQCQSYLTELHEQAGPYYPYNIYDTCGPPTTTLFDQFCDWGLSWACKHLKKQTPQFPVEDNVGSPLWDCGRSAAMNAYLNTPSVQEAIHVQATKWPGGVTYNRTIPDLSGVVKSLLDDYRMLIYSGDFDSQIPFTSTQEWVESLGFPVLEKWRPWKISSGAVAGYTTSYKVPKNELTFLTIRGAGHMVPQNRPQEALEFITKFISNQPY